MTTRTSLTVGLLIVCLTLASVAHSGDRPELYRFAPPYPILPPLFATDQNAPILPHEVLITAHLQVDGQGRVSSLASDSTDGFGLAAYVDGYLRGLAFHPASFAGREIASILPVEVRLRAGDRIPSFSFPVDSTGNAGDGRLYRATFPLNDIALPTVARFPSYFGAPNVDTTAMYRYLLMAVDLDTAGRYVDARTLINAYPAFEAQIMAALLWSEFAPAVVKGEAIPSTIYLLISFFGAVAYPTTIWPPVASDTVNLLENLRIRTYPDRVGLMTPPLPKNHPHDTYGLGPDHPFWRDTVYVQVEIDNRGQARMVGGDRPHAQLRSAVRDVVGSCDFYPALDFEGRPQEYRGRVALEFTGTPNVRIRYLWLP